MKSQIIATDQPIVANPNDGDVKNTYIRSKKYGKISVAEMQEQIRKPPKAYRGSHSDGFLAISNEAKECFCGGCAVYEDGYKCPRCGRIV